MTLDAIAARLAPEWLAPFGACHGGAEDGLAPGTLVLIGPDEPGFWAHVTASAEWRDGAPDPLDRWSSRVIGALARETGAEAIFPFGGPPWHPFHRWALRSGRAWDSPVRLLVHDRAGLMVSYRGALLMPGRLALPPAARCPCDDCTKPCLTACPAGALTGAGYDVPACRAFLDRPGGRDCMDRGCTVRRACPVSRGYGRLAEQSAWHMRRFHIPAQKGTAPK